MKNFDVPFNLYLGLFLVLYNANFFNWNFWYWLNGQVCYDWDSHMALEFLLYYWDDIIFFYPMQAFELDLNFFIIDLNFLYEYSLLNFPFFSLSIKFNKFTFFPSDYLSYLLNFHICYKIISNSSLFSEYKLFEAINFIVSRYFFCFPSLNDEISSSGNLKNIDMSNEDFEEDKEISAPLAVEDFVSQMVPSYGPFIYTIEYEHLFEEISEQFEVEEDYPYVVEDHHLNECIMRVDFLNFLMDHLPYFYLMNDSEKAKIYFSSLDKTAPLYFTRDDIATLNDTAATVGFFFNHNMDEGDFEDPRYIPTEEKLKEFNSRINNFSDRYLGKYPSNFLAREEKLRKIFQYNSSEDDIRRNKYIEDLKKIKWSENQYSKMTDSPYEKTGRLLDYHWDYENLKYDFKLILPYFFMPEGYRTIDIQTFFSPTSSKLLKKFNYSKYFINLQHFNFEEDYFLSLNLDRENSVTTPIFDNPRLLRLNCLKILKIIKN